MEIPNARFEEFFMPLVGTEETVNGLQGELSAIVRDASSPYVALKDSLMAAAQVSIEDGRGHSQSEQEDDDWSKISANKNVGLRLAVAGLEHVGGLYAKYATAPQHIANVQRSTAKTLRHINGIAYGDVETALINIYALREGKRPEDVRAEPHFIREQAITRMAAGKHINLSQDSFRVEEIEAGQLVIAPRYKRLKGVPGRRCPAVHATVMGPEGRRSALLTLIQVAGSVAIAEIFPKQFATDYEITYAAPPAYSGYVTLSN